MTLTPEIGPYTFAITTDRYKLNYMASQVGATNLHKMYA